MWENACIRTCRRLFCLRFFLSSYFHIPFLSFLFLHGKNVLRAFPPTFVGRKGFISPPPFLSGNNKNAFFPRELCSSAAVSPFRKKRVGEMIEVWLLQFRSPLFVKEEVGERLFLPLFLLERGERERERERERGHQPQHRLQKQQLIPPRKKRMKNDPMATAFSHFSVCTNKYIFCLFIFRVLPSSVGLAATVKKIKYQTGTKDGSKR